MARMLTSSGKHPEQKLLTAFSKLEVWEQALPPRADRRHPTILAVVNSSSWEFRASEIPSEYPMRVSPGESSSCETTKSALAKAPRIGPPSERTSTEPLRRRIPGGWPAEE
jgi:hypothetical protein